MDNTVKLTSRILIILKYLWENTDENHTASLADITAYLESLGVSGERRTLQKDIDQLVEFGIDIVKTARFKTNTMWQVAIFKHRRSGYLSMRCNLLDSLLRRKASS